VPTAARNDVDISGAEQLPPLLPSIQPEIVRETRDFFSPRIERDTKYAIERQSRLAPKIEILPMISSVRGMLRYEHHEHTAASVSLFLLFSP
jgi:hypothetical protein